MVAVDIGNTFLRVAAFAGGDICDRRSLPVRKMTAEALSPLLAGAAAVSDAKTLWIASVAPWAEPIVVDAAARAGLPPPRFIRSGEDEIMPHRLATPRTTGVDRLLSSLAAGSEHFPGTAGDKGYVTVQCGSAATVDLVDRDGFFRGGHILPGPGLWLAGLSGAAQLPDFSATPPDWEATAAGDNTRDAIMRGLAAALPAAVAASARRLAASAGGEALPIVVTGGWGQEAVRALGGTPAYDRDLLLRGIRLFAEGRQ